jgi:hypothetical protein
MSFATSLGAFTNVATRLPDGGATEAARGLDLADQKIQEVIESIQAELDDLDPTEFENNGHISAVSFGGGDRAPEIALHHTRAHGVTADTLNGVLEDLRTFRQACSDARQLIADTDQDTADQLQRTQGAVEALTTASWTNQGEDSNRQAQQDHMYDTPSDEPEGGDA